MFMSPKTVLSNITPVVNQKGNRSYNLFAVKVAFSSLYSVLQFLAFTWCLEWVIALQKNFW